MAIDLRIRVFGSSSASKPILERILRRDSSEKIDFNGLFSSFRFLFGEHCMIIIEYL